MRTRSATARHPWLRFVAMLALAAGMASVGIAGCHDTLPVEPAPVPAPEAALSTYPTVEQLAEMPSEFQKPTAILDYWVEARFFDQLAYGNGSMTYFANHAKVTLPVKLLYKNSEVTSTVGVAEETHFLPALRQLGAMATLPAGGSCGYTVTVSGEFYAHNQFLYNKSWLVWGETKRSSTNSASQPACSCTDAPRLQTADYDPYSRDQGESGCNDGSGGGGGSGIQYKVGDYTNGETVSWSAGTGNGGTSLCGSAAMVDFVCLDFWNAETQKWQEWSCGFITYCGYTAYT
ncbi:MAG: hypothetical protein ACSLFE_04355 [Gemmatimonadaceae bacterium]